MSINLNKPLAPDLKVLNKYLEVVNNNAWYTNFGPLHNELTERLEDYLDVQNLLLVSNGTLALQVAYKALNINSAITTPFSFVATTSSMLWQNIEVDFADIDQSSYNLCPDACEKALAQSPKDAVVATHLFGNPCDVEKFSKVQENTGCKLIYDAAHAFSTKLRERSILSYGDASTLSFHATKLFHTIEGGAVVFKQKSDFDRARKIINFGIGDGGIIGDIGINAKLNEYQSAVGLTLLDKIDEVIEHRVNLFNAYKNGLKDHVKLPHWLEEASLNGAYFPIELENPDQLKTVETALSFNTIQSRRYFKQALHQAYANKEAKRLNNVEKVSACILCLPLHYYMSIFDIKNVCNIIKSGL